MRRVVPQRRIGGLPLQLGDLRRLPSTSKEPPCRAHAFGQRVEPFGGVGRHDGRVYRRVRPRAYASPMEFETTFDLLLTTTFADLPNLLVLDQEPVTWLFLEVPDGD